MLFSSLSGRILKKEGGKNMQSTITARFVSADEADRAVARLRRTIPYIQAEASGPIRSQMPAAAPLAASIYYPWRMNMTFSDQSTRSTEFGSRILLNSDLMGLPRYHDGETEVQLQLDAKDTERARALLLNMGGSSIQVF